MSMYVHGKTRTARGQRRLDEQNAAMAKRNLAIDERRRAEQRRRVSREPARPHAEVFAEAELVRQWAVSRMIPADYDQGPDRLKAATAEAETWRFTAAAQQRNQGSEAA